MKCPQMSCDVRFAFKAEDELLNQKKRDFPFIFHPFDWYAILILILVFNKWKMH